VVNGKPAIEWVMERQCVKVDKASGIVNDANRYAIETVGNPAYPLRLLQQVITVSLETMRIVKPFQEWIFSILKNIWNYFAIFIWKGNIMEVIYRTKSNSRQKFRLCHCGASWRPFSIFGFYPDR
jgi:hypothetical protein